MERVFAKLFKLLEATELRLEGLYLNADRTFDISSLRQTYTRCAIV